MSSYNSKNTGGKSEGGQVKAHFLQNLGALVDSVVVVCDLLIQQRHERCLGVEAFKSIFNLYPQAELLSPVVEREQTNLFLKPL